jgi:hypothetical protein
MGKNRTTSSMSVQSGIGGAGAGAGAGGAAGRAGWYPGTGELIMKMDSRLKVSPCPIHPHSPRPPFARLKDRLAAPPPIRSLENLEHVCQGDGDDRSKGRRRRTG